MIIPIILVDYNSIKKTLEYVEQFSSYCDDGNNYRPIVIDNYEKQDSFEYLKKKYEIKLLKEIEIESSRYEVFEFKTKTSECIYVNAGVNLGYAKGNNLGTIIADTLFQPSYYIVSNNDLNFTSEFDFEKFEKIFDLHEDIAVIGPRIITPEGTFQSPRKEVSAFKRLILAPWISLPPFNVDPDLDYTNESKYCYYVVGCFMIIKAKCFRQANRFDEHTFLFSEEPILSERLKKLGYRVWFEDEYALIHDHGGTINKKTGHKQRDKYLFDSLRYYYKEYKGTSDFMCLLSKINVAVSGAAKTIVKKIVKKV